VSGDDAAVAEVRAAIGDIEAVEAKRWASMRLKH
jgi:D-aminopeptidase